MGAAPTRPTSNREAHRWAARQAEPNESPNRTAVTGASVHPEGTWPRVRRLRTGTTYWRRSFCMGRGRCESQPDLTFVTPANAANDRQGRCPILKLLPQQAAAIWKSRLLASNCSDPESRTRQVGFGPLLTRDAESLLHQDGFNSNRAVVGRRKSTAGLRLEVRQAKASPPLEHGSFGISDSFAHLPGPPGLVDSPGRDPPEEHGWPQYSRSTKTIIVQGRHGTPGSGA